MGNSTTLILMGLILIFIMMNIVSYVKMRDISGILKIDLKLIRNRIPIYLLFLFQFLGIGILFTLFLEMDNLFNILVGFLILTGGLFIHIVLINGKDALESFQALRVSKEYLSNVFNSMMDMVLIFDEHGRVIRNNQYAEDILGYDEDEFEELKCSDIFTSEDDSHLQWCRKFIQGGIDGSENHFYRSKNNESIAVSVRGSILKDEQGNYIGTISVARDIRKNIAKDQQLHLYAMAMEQSPNALVITSREGEIEYVNKSFTNITGYTWNDVIGKNPRILSSHKHPKSFYTAMWAAIKKDYYWSGQIQNKKKNGELYWSQLGISAIYDKNNKLINYLAIQRDITEEKLIRDNVNRTLEIQNVINKLLKLTFIDDELSDILNKALDTVLEIPLVKDQITKGAILIANQSERMFSIIAEKNISPETILYCQNIPFDECFGGTMTESSKLEFYTYDDVKDDSSYMGSENNTHFVIPIKSTKEILGVLVFYFDKNYSPPNEDIEFANVISNAFATIIERYQAKRSLIENEDRYRSLAMSANDAIIGVDGKGIINVWNKAAVEMFLYTEEEAIGYEIHKLIAPAYYHATAAKGMKRFRVIGKGPVLNNNVEFGALRKDGKTIFIELSISSWKKGNEWQATAVIRDVTQRKEADERLKNSEMRHKKLSKELSKTNDMKDLLLDIITHDLKNPIGVINGMMDMMTPEMVDDEVIDIMKTSSENLISVVANATILSKVSMGEEIEKDDVDISLIIENIVHGFLPYYKSRNMEIFNNIHESLIVQTHPIIEEIFKNYISNAGKYAQSGGKITIEAHHEPSYLMVEVIDYGQSIPEADHEKIFMRSVRVGSNKESGRGLGLAIVKRIAYSLGCSVGVKNNTPTGNIFFVKIPK